MPFPQVAKDNLAATLALANLLTNDNGQYLPLDQQISALQELQKFLTWQSKNPFQVGNPGRNPVKVALSGYLKMEGSVDLFMRYWEIPAYQQKDNLAYLTGEIQKLVYRWFKDEVLRKELGRSKLIELRLIEKAIKGIVKERVAGYSAPLEGQEREEWQIFVAEVDTDIAKLCQDYRKIFSDLHEHFLGFRKDQMAFTQCYFNRCMLLAQFESWLNNVPSSLLLPRLSDERMTALCEALTAIRQSHKDEDTKSLFERLNQLRGTSLSAAQYKTLATLLISLKPKYDAYRAGQGNLTADQQVEQFLDRWPKPALPVRPASKSVAEASWEKARSKDRVEQVKAVDEQKELRHKPAGQTRMQYI